MIEPIADAVGGLIALESFVRSLPVPATCTRDRAATAVTMNRAFAQILGIEPEAYRSLQEDPDSPRPYHFEIDGRPMRVEDAPLRRAARGEYVDETPLDVVLRDGSRRRLSGWASPVFTDDGAWCGAFSVFHDVTAELDADERIREMAEFSPSLAFRVAPDGSIEFVNERWAQLCGVARNAFLGSGWKAFVEPSELHLVEEAWIRAFRSGSPFSAEWRMRRADGSFGWIRAQAVPVPGPGGTIKTWVGSGFDIDDQRRTLSAMLQLEAAGSIISADIDAHALVNDLARSAIDLGFADLCLFDVREPDGSGTRTVAAGKGVDPRIADRVSLSLAPPPDLVVDETFDSAESPVRSRVVAPLRSSGRTFGSVAMLRMHPRRGFSDIGTRAIEEIGKRAGVAIEKIRLNEAARARSDDRGAQFRRLADIMPQLMWTTDGAGAIDWYNARWYDYTGRDPADGPYDGDDLYHPDDVDAMESYWAISQATGEPFDMELRIRDRNGSYRWFLSRATAARDSSGRIERWYGSDTDVDDERRLTRSVAALNELGRSLGETLGLAATMDVALTTFVPEYADWAFVTLSDDDGDVRLGAVRHGDRRHQDALAAHIGEVYARADAPMGTATVARTGRPYQSSDLDYAVVAAVIEPALLDTFWKAGIGSLLIVPMTVGSVVRGTLNLVRYDRSRPFEKDELPMYEEFARRLGPAIANAELYERERRVAQSFQQAALPAELPNREGYRFSAIYEAGKAEALVGGDWYDAFTLADGRIVISIGDVAGSGLQAAVTMSSVRQSIRAVAQVHAEPALMLAAADRSLRSESPDRFVTAFVGVIDPVSRAFSYAGAGHHPPLVRSGDGSIAEYFAPGLPLGLRDGDRGVTLATTLPEDAFIVLYTDGLIESTHDADEGDRRVRAALADPTTVTSDYPAAAIRDAVLVEGSRDDVAILTVSIGKPPELAIWSFDARDGAAAIHAKREIGERLREAGHSADRIVTAELLISELIGNTVRYAPGPIEVMLERPAADPIVHVLDRGPGFAFSAKLPPDLFSESGRGLFLIATLAADLTVALRPDGGSHARVLLAVR